jgi:hypothetical protein
VPLLVQELGPVVLAVDVQQVSPQLPQLGHGEGPAVGTADVFPVAGYLPLEEQVPVLVRGQPVLQQARQIRRDGGELRADKSLGGPGADKVPGGPPPQDGPHGVDDDGFARAGFAGQGVEAGTELDVRLLNDRDILNVQKLQHGNFSP